MRIGFVGLGKLGLPCGLAMEQCGHVVFGVDPSPITKEILESGQLAYTEALAQPALDHTRIKLTTYAELVRDAELIFVAVQTPHHRSYEGVTPIPNTREDFDYSFLRDAVAKLCCEMVRQGVDRDVAVISTVLPGTMASQIKPIIANHGLESRFRLAYNPYFIAMGTAMSDFLNPEFTLVGADHPEAAVRLEAFYRTIHKRPVFKTTVENAELIKVTYNTFISTKIAIANTIMEICHKTPGTDCDQVVDALSLATERLISPKYLRGGMGDGGGCHPRDNIAMSWLAQKLELSHDLFQDIMQARQDQTHWFIDLIKQHAGFLPVRLLGVAFKPDTNIRTGSPAVLLSYYLAEHGIQHQSYDPPVNLGGQPACYFVSTRHTAWKTLKFPAGSVVLDPFRYLADNPSIADCTYVPIGGNHAVRRFDSVKSKT